MRENDLYTRIRRLPGVRDKKSENTLGGKRGGMPLLSESEKRR